MSWSSVCVCLCVCVCLGKTPASGLVDVMFFCVRVHKCRFACPSKPSQCTVQANRQDQKADANEHYNTCRGNCQCQPAARSCSNGNRTGATPCRVVGNKYKDHHLVQMKPLLQQSKSHTTRALALCINSSASTGPRLSLCRFQAKQVRLI